MNNYKVGDKVLYDGEVHTVKQVPVDGLTLEDDDYLDKDYVVLDLHYANAIYYKDIEPYFTPHERLLKLGWEMRDTDGTYKVYDKYQRAMSIEIYKDGGGWYLVAYTVLMDKELVAILLEYLEELENSK